MFKDRHKTNRFQGFNLINNINIKKKYRSYDKEAVAMYIINYVEKYPTGFMSFK